MKDIEQTDLFYSLHDKIDNKDAKFILENSFYHWNIEDRTHNQVLEIIQSIKDLNILNKCSYKVFLYTIKGAVANKKIV